jgi:hypothetical protein
MPPKKKSNKKQRQQTKGRKKNANNNNIQDVTDGLGRAKLSDTLTGQRGSSGSAGFMTEGDEMRKIFLESAAERAGCSVGDLFSMDETRSRLQEEINSSLGDGYDAANLKRRCVISSWKMMTFIMMILQI